MPTLYLLSHRGAALCLLATALLSGWPGGAAHAQPVAFDGPELLLSTGHVSDTPAAGLAPGPDGGFFAVWHGSPPEGDAGAHYRAFDASGAPLGDPRRVPVQNLTSRVQSAPEVAGDRSAGFAVLQWIRTGGDHFLELSAYRPSGDRRSGPARLSAPQARPLPAAVALGGPGPQMVVVYGHGDPDWDFLPYRLVARRYERPGAAPGSEIEVSGELEHVREASVAVGADGGFAVAWTGEPEFMPAHAVVRVFGADGSPAGPSVPLTPLQVSSLATAVTPGPGDGYTAWYLVLPFRATDATLWRREVGPDGQFRGEATAVASGLSMNLGHQVEAAVDPLGNAVVVWTAETALATRTEVFARAYGADGFPLGPAFRVHAEVAGGQRVPAVTAVAAKRFAVAWRSQEDFDEENEIRGQLVRLRPGQTADERPPVALAPEQVACDEARLRGLLERLSSVPPIPEAAVPRGVVLSFTRSGDFAGVAHAASSAGGGAESQLAFSTNAEETPLLRNPERPPLASASLSRNPASSNLVPAGALGRLRLVLDPTLQGSGDPPEQALLVIDNVAGTAGTASSARPGRGLAPLVTPCHDLFAADDVQVFRVLQKVLRPEVPGAAEIETAVYRGEEPGVFRIDVFPVGARGESLGRLAAELRVEWTPDGQLWTGEVRLLPRCGDGLVRDCTSVAGPAVFRLVEPTFGALDGPLPASVRLEASGGVDPALTHRWLWRDLLAGSTWLETP